MDSVTTPAHKRLLEGVHRELLKNFRRVEARSPTLETHYISGIPHWVPLSAERFACYGIHQTADANACIRGLAVANATRVLVCENYYRARKRCGRKRRRGYRFEYVSFIDVNGVTEPDFRGSSFRRIASAAECAAKMYLMCPAYVRDPRDSAVCKYIIRTRGDFQRVEPELFVRAVITITEHIGQYFSV